MSHTEVHGTLMAGAESALVGLSELRAIEPPPPLGPWHRPVQHGELVDRVRDSLVWNGVKIERENYAVGGTRGEYENVNLFGVLDVRVPGTGNGHGEWSFALGVRSNNTREFAIQMVVGARVIVCDNMMLSGDSIVLGRRHTSGLRLGDEVNEGVERYLEHAAGYQERIARMKSRHVHDGDVKRVMWDIFTRGVLPTRLLKPVNDFYFKRGIDSPDEYPDCAPRSVWGVHNSVTRSLRELPFMQRFTRTQGFERFMEGSELGYTVN